MTEPSRAEMIVWLTDWAAQNEGALLEVNGQCGIGRDCVGISKDGHYIDTEEAKNATAYNHGSPHGSWWEPEDAYHKHDCLAVLGHGEGPLRQLYDWVRWLDDHGWKVEIRSRKPANDIDLLFNGVVLPVLVKAAEGEVRGG